MNTKLSANPDIRGIGGWLLLLILYLGLYIPVTGAWSLYREFIIVPQKMPILEANPLWVQYRLMVWIVFGILCVLCFAAAYGLWRIKRPMTVQLAIGVLWLAGPFVPVMYAAIAASIFNMDFSQALKPFLIGIFSTSVQSAIWTGYLVKSVRVKNTYYP